MVAIIFFTSKWNIRFLYWTLKHQKFQAKGVRFEIECWICFPFKAKLIYYFILSEILRLNAPYVEHNFVKRSPNISSVFQWLLLQWRLQFTSSRHRIRGTPRRQLLISVRGWRVQCELFPFSLSANVVLFDDRKILSVWSRLQYMGMKLFAS